MKIKILGLLAVGLLAGPMAANAVPVTYDFSASNFVDSIYGSVSPPYSTVNGSFVWDGSSLAAFDLTIGTKTYTLADVGLGFDYAIGGLTTGPIGLTPGTDDFALRFTGPFVFFDFFYTTAGIDTIWKSSTGTITERTAVPEPGTLALLGLGLAGLGLSRRRKAV